MKVDWSKINKFIYKYRWYISVVLVVVFLLILFNPAYADSAGEIAKAIGAVIASLFVMLLYYVFFTPLLWLIAIAIWILVEVASFQYFINVPAVVDGWILMRDLVNMMFVMYLLYFAFTTILSLAKDFSKTLIKLILLVILVNFSRMIVGMLIDFSQIVMLTFVNGFRNIAGGNIINGLGLKNFVKVEMTTDFDTAGANFIKVSLGIWAAIIILSTLAMMVAFLILRVVKLWILTVMSPLMAMGFLFSGLKDFTGKWKKEFSDCLMGGPFMAFYLWLSLTIISTTGDETALTTPTGSMADKMGGTSASMEKTMSSDVFRIVVGAGILYASFQMAKGMAGEAAKVGDAVYGYTKGKVVGGAKAIAKAVPKAADAGIGLASSRYLGKDLSYSGAKDYVKLTKEKWKSGIAAKKREWLQKGLKKRDVGSIKSAKKTDKYQALDKRFEESKGQFKKKEEEFKGLEGEEKNVKEELKEKKGIYENAQNKISTAKESGQTKLSAAGMLKQAMSEGKASSYDDTISSIDQLVASGDMTKEDADNFKSNLTANPDGSAGAFVTEEMKDKVSKIEQKAQETLSVADQLEDPNLGEAERKQLLQKHGQDFGLEADEQDVLATGTGSISEQLEKIKQRKVKATAEKTQAKKKMDKLKTEKEQVVMQQLLKERKSVGRMVLRNRSNSNRKVQREFFKEKFAGIDNPKEFAAAIQTTDDKEELNYLLEQSKDDLSEVLDILGSERNLDGLKGLYASKTKLSRGSKNKLKKKSKQNPKLPNIKTDDDINKLVEKVRKGNGSTVESDAVTELLDENMTRDDFESWDVIDKQNRQSNLALSHSITLEPDGMQKLEKTDNQRKIVESKYKRGMAHAKAMTPFLTNKTDSGKVELTNTGISFALTHPREISKDNIADEMGKDFLNAIQNETENLKKIVKESLEQGIIKGELQPNGEPIKNFQPKKDYKNQASYILHSLDKMNSQVGDSKSKELMDIIKGMQNKE